MKRQTNRRKQNGEACKFLFFTKVFSPVLLTKWTKFSLVLRSFSVRRLCKNRRSRLVFWLKAFFVVSSFLNLFWNTARFFINLAWNFATCNREKLSIKVTTIVCCVSTMTSHQTRLYTNKQWILSRKSEAKEEKNRCSPTQVKTWKKVASTVFFHCFDETDKSKLVDIPSRFRLHCLVQRARVARINHRSSSNQKGFQLNRFL